MTNEDDIKAGDVVVQMTVEDVFQVTDDESAAEHHRWVTELRAIRERFENLVTGTGPRNPGAEP